MSELALVSRPALADVALGLFGAASAEPGVVMTALPEGHVLHVLAAPTAGDIHATLQEACESFGSSVRGGLPGQYFVTGDRVLTGNEIRGLATVLAPLAAISDQSHGRVRVGVSGQRVLAMLAKGIGADLDISVFPVGHASVMISGHVSVHVTRTGPDSFELMALRGFASDLWESLVHQSLEYGLDCRSTES